MYRYKRLSQGGGVSRVSGPNIGFKLFWIGPMQMDLD